MQEGTKKIICIKTAHCKAIERVYYIIMKDSTLSGKNECSFGKMVLPLLRCVDDKITSVDIAFTEIG